jgi:hypothetical protein
MFLGSDLFQSGEKYWILTRSKTRIKLKSRLRDCISYLKGGWNRQEVLNETVCLKGIVDRLRLDSGDEMF